MNDGRAVEEGPAREQVSGGTPQGLLLVALATLPTLAIAALVPILPTLFERFKDVPRAQWLVPMILTVPSLCVALFSSLIGAIADRFGRRRALLISLLGFAVFGLGPFLVENLYAILGTRFVVGIAEAGIVTIGNALIGDYFPGAERRRWLAVQTVVGPFAAVAYVLLGGALGGWSWRGPFLLYLLGLVVFFPSLWLLREPTHVAERSQAHSFRDFPWLVALQVGAVTLFCSVVFFVQNVQHGRIFSDLGARSPELISWVITAAGMGTVLGGIAYHYIRGRSVATLLAIIFASYGVGYVGLAFSPNYWVGVPFDSMGQFAGGFLIPVLIGWTLSRYPLEYRGRGMGMWVACFFLGEFLSPPLVTLIGHGQWSFLTSVGVVGAVCVVCAVIAGVLGRRRLAAAPAESIRAS